MHLESPGPFPHASPPTAAPSWAGLVARRLGSSFIPIAVGAGQADRVRAVSLKLQHPHHQGPANIRGHGIGSQVSCAHLGNEREHHHGQDATGCHLSSTYRSSGSGGCRPPSQATQEAAPQVRRLGASSMNPHGALCWSGHDIALQDRGAAMSLCPARRLPFSPRPQTPPPPAPLQPLGQRLWKAPGWPRL